MMINLGLEFKCQECDAGTRLYLLVEDIVDIAGILVPCTDKEGHEEGHMMVVVGIASQETG